MYCKTISGHRESESVEMSKLSRISTSGHTPFTYHGLKDSFCETRDRQLPASRKQMVSLTFCCVGRQVPVIVKVWRHKSRIFLALVAFILLEANGEPEHDFGEKNSFLLMPQDLKICRLGSGKPLLLLIV